MASKEVEKAMNVFASLCPLWSSGLVRQTLETLEKEVEQRQHKLAKDLTLGTMKL